MRLTAAVLGLALAACSSEPPPPPDDPKPTPPPDLVELPAWPAAAAPRTLPKPGIEIAPALVRGHQNTRTPSPDTLSAGTARPLTAAAAASLQGSLALADGPANLNQLQVLRIRQVGGERPSAILVLVPGLMAGATSFLTLGSEIVEGARAQGATVEVWAVDRRSNLLEDRHGILAAQAAADPAKAFDYYGLEGHPAVAVSDWTFAPVPQKDILFQAEWGLDTHLRDYRAVVLAAQKRGDKVFLGGHSLGGDQAALYLGYDFAKPGEEPAYGNADVAGVVSLDSVPYLYGTDPATAEKSFLEGGAPTDFGFPMPGLKELRTPRDGDTLSATFLAVKGLFDPPLMQELAAGATGAVFAPEKLGRVTVPSLFVVGGSGPRTLVGPWKAILPASLDDDFVTVSALRFSLGFVSPDFLVKTSRQADKTNPNGLWAIGPTSEQQPLVWIDSKALATQPADASVPQYGKAEPEDVALTAQAISGGPTADFLEWYFPLRLLLDLQLAQDLNLDTAKLANGELADDGGVETELVRHGETGLRLTGMAQADAAVMVLRAEYGIIQGASLADAAGAEKQVVDFGKTLAPSRYFGPRVTADGKVGTGLRYQTLAGYTHNDVLFASPNACTQPIVEFLLSMP